MFRVVFKNYFLSRRLIVGCRNLSIFVTSAALCLSLFLAYEVNVLKDDLETLKGEFVCHYQRTSQDFDNGHFMSHMWEKLKMTTSKRSHHMGIQQDHQRPTVSSYLRKKRNWRDVRTQKSFLQLRAAANEFPVLKGNEMSIPWSIAIQHGESVFSTNNTIVVKRESYYMVFGQVLFCNPGTVMGHLIRHRKSNPSGTEQRFTDLLRCLQQMPQNNCANSCYTAGIVKLEEHDELELVILDRLETKVAMDADSTFFGIIQLI